MLTDPSHVVEQPLSIACPEAGGHPGVSLALNRARSTERLQAIKTAHDRMLKFYENSLTKDGDLQHWQRAALEHSEFGALLDMGYEIPTDQSDKTVVVTTVGRAVCSLCVGESSTKSGIAEIMLAYRRKSLIIQSWPLRDKSPFVSKWLAEVDNIPGKIATKILISTDPQAKTYKTMILEVETQATEE